MIYLFGTAIVERSKVNEVLEFWGKEIKPWDKYVYDQVDGKIIGVWTTDIGEKGEILMVGAVPDYESLEKVRQIPIPKEMQETFEKWREMIVESTWAYLKPASFSPLQ